MDPIQRFVTKRGVKFAGIHYQSPCLAEFIGRKVSLNILSNDVFMPVDIVCLVKGKKIVLTACTPVQNLTPLEKAQLIFEEYQELVDEDADDYTSVLRLFVEAALPGFTLKRLAG